MLPERNELGALVEEVAAFYVTNRTMLRAQHRMTAALARPAGPSERDVERYLATVRSYFAGFEREARAHLADVDRRLAKAAQLQFNLTAERGVGAKRVEKTQGVLARLRELAQR